MKTFLSVLYKNFDVERVGTSTDVSELFGFTMSPAGLKVRLHPRERDTVARTAALESDPPVVQQGTRLAPHWVLVASNRTTCAVHGDVNWFRTASTQRWAERLAARNSSASGNQFRASLSCVARVLPWLRVCVHVSCCMAFGRRGHEDEWFALTQGYCLAASGLDPAPTVPARRHRSIRAAVAS